MASKDWKPDLYLKYGKERLQPSLDLASKISFDNVKSIIDVGCGPGNSTIVLSEKWPDAAITGVDSSPAMIERAKRDYPFISWNISDISKDSIPDSYDIVFSNAVIQWVPDHENLLKKFHTMLNAKGVLAVQLPLFWSMPLGKAILSVAKEDKWHEQLASVEKLFTINDSSFYYNILSSLYSSCDIWETSYIHIMDSHLAILEMIRSTGLKPFLDKLSTKDEIEKFESCILTLIEKDYPAESNGKVLFPFKRLFFTAVK